MANDAMRRRGRPPKPRDIHAQTVVDWQSVPLLLDPGLVACIIGKQYEAVRRLFASGELPGFQIGCEWRIRKDALMAFLGYQPWEIARYGYGITIDRRERMENAQDAGAFLSITQEGATV